jgi:hypothetical protein
MIADTEISVEFDGKEEIIKWSAPNAAEVVKICMSTHNVQALHIQGWFSELEIPCLDSGLEASNTLYNIEKHDLERMSLLAAIKGFPMVKGRHILKIWVVAPLPGLAGRAPIFHDVFLMVLLPISDPVVSDL